LQNPFACKDGRETCISAAIGVWWVFVF
jgi:hypothetical protein